MTYNTPELLLVGAAQNLVLGGSDVPTQCIKGTDSPLNDNYDTFEDW